MNRLKTIKKLPFWLLSLATGLIAIHLTLTWRSDYNDLLSCSLLFWVAACYLIWEKRESLNLETDVLSSFIGVSLISLILVKSLNIFGHDLFLRISPFISILAVGLLASGWQGLKQYWQGLLLFGFLAVPWESIYLFIDLSLLTAKFSTFVLWVLGFEVKRQGIMVSLPTGAIEVYNGCSGLRMILQLLGIALIFVVAIANTLRQKILIPIVAIILGFAINGVRVALMTVLAALSDAEAFDYWHFGNGSLTFSLIAVIILALISAFIYQSENHNEVVS